MEFADSRKKSQKKNKEKKPRKLEIENEEGKLKNVHI